MKIYAPEAIALSRDKNPNFEQISNDMIHAKSSCGFLSTAMTFSNVSREIVTLEELCENLRSSLLMT